MTDEKVKLIMIGGVVAFITIIGSYLTIEAYENHKQHEAIKFANKELEKFKANVALAEERNRLAREKLERINEAKRLNAEANKAKLEQQRKFNEEQAKIEQEKIKKETSKECQFWKLQQSKEATDKAEEKIKEYCGYI